MRFKKILVFFLFILVIFVVIWKFNIFSVEKITVYSNAECVNEKELKDELNLVGKNLLRLYSIKIKEEILAKHLCVKDINIIYEFPRNLKIVVSSRKFLTKVVSFNQTLNILNFESSASSETALIDWSFPPESSNSPLIVDDTGLIFSNNLPNFPLPTLYISENIFLGKQIDKIFFSLIDNIFTKILQQPPLSNEPDFKAKIFQNILFINTSPKLVISLEKDILKQLASLQLILQKAKMDERILGIIDLRFDKPVIQYQPTLSK